jgi:hypothetical protein
MSEEAPQKKSFPKRGYRISSEDLSLVIEGCVCSVRRSHSRRENNGQQLLFHNLKIKAILSSYGSNILEVVKKSVEMQKEFEHPFDYTLFSEMLKECLNNYTYLDKRDKEFIFKAINYLDWDNINILTQNLMAKLKSEFNAEIERLKLLQSSIEAGHTNTDILQEYLDLLHRLTSLRIIPNSYSKVLVKKVSNLFLENVKNDEKAAAISRQSRHN